MGTHLYYSHHQISVQLIWLFQRKLRHHPLWSAQKYTDRQSTLASSDIHNDNLCKIWLIQRSELVFPMSRPYPHPKMQLSCSFGHESCKLPGWRGSMIMEQEAHEIMVPYCNVIRIFWELHLELVSDFWQIIHDFYIRTNFKRWHGGLKLNISDQIDIWYYHFELMSTILDANDCLIGF